MRAACPQRPLRRAVGSVLTLLALLAAGLVAAAPAPAGAVRASALPGDCAAPQPLLLSGGQASGRPSKDVIGLGCPSTTRSALRSGRAESVVVVPPNGPFVLRAPEITGDSTLPAPSLAPPSVRARQRGARSPPR